jgi:hypothetical protein
MQASPYSPKDDQRLMTELWSPQIAEDPLAFVMFNFPWGKENTPLEKFKEPRVWQIDELLSMKQHIIDNKLRMARGETPHIYKSATSSGRGPGKSAFTSWVNLWMMSCVLGSTAVTTANTGAQLQSRTWAELGKWHTIKN